MRERIGGILLGLACLALLAACGGSGTAPQPAQQAYTVVKAISVTNPPLAAISATLTFPRGVTVQTEPTDPFTAAPGVVQLVNAQPAGGQVAPTLVFARYSAATATAPGKLKFTVLDVRGFTTAELIGIQLDVPPGFFPQAADFAISNAVFSDINGAAVTGITPTLTATIQ